MQYGAGDKFISGWESYDASPTLRIQNIPVVGRILRSRLNCVFDDGIKYGDIVKGLPIPEGSVDVVFCSHVLEHLALSDFYLALENTYKIIRRGGLFRVVVPDLQLDIIDYMAAINSEAPKAQAEASINFCKNTVLGRTHRNRSVAGVVSALYGNSQHRWMWDAKSLPAALAEKGFVDIRSFQKGESDDPVVLLPEQDHQFERGIGFECKKP